MIPTKDNYKRHNIIWDFETQTDHLIFARKPDFGIIRKKKKTCCIMYFTVPTNCREKTKVNEKRDNYLNITENMKITVIPIVIGAFGMLSKSLERGLKNWKSGDESRLSKLHYCLRPAEYRK